MGINFIKSKKRLNEKKKTTYVLIYKICYHKSIIHRHKINQFKKHLSEKK